MTKYFCDLCGTEMDYREPKTTSVRVHDKAVAHLVFEMAPSGDLMIDQMRVHARLLGGSDITICDACRPALVEKFTQSYTAAEQTHLDLMAKRKERRERK